MPPGLSPFPLNDLALRLGLAAAASVPLGWLCARSLEKFVGADRAPRAVLLGSLLLAALLWGAAAGPTGWLFAATVALAWALLTLATVDVIDFRLPDALTLPLTAAGIAASLLLPAPDPAGHLAGAVVGYGALAAVAWAYRRLRGREGLGLGDAKLMAAAGAWLGWQSLPSVLLLACAIAALWLIVVALLKGVTSLQSRIAFGAPISLAFWIVWLHGPLTPFS
ncbi:MAG: prepilin peptidase [Caulobacteraceae bacterium]